MKPHQKRVLTERKQLRERLDGLKSFIAESAVFPTLGDTAALCQKCHLTYDAKLHATNARITRDLRSGQMPLILG